MANSVLTVIALIALFALTVVWMHWRHAVRARYIRTYVLPVGLHEKLRQKRPQLSLKDCQLVGRALRQRQGGGDNSGVTHCGGYFSSS